MKLGPLLKTWIFNKGECSRKGGRRRFAVWCFYNGYENSIESPKWVLLSVAMLSVIILSVDMLNVVAPLISVIFEHDGITQQPLTRINNLRFLKSSFVITFRQVNLHLK
jgi:hypothetical protein